MLLLFLDPRLASVGPSRRKILSSGEFDWGGTFVER